MHQGKENTFQRNFVPLHHFEAAKYQLVLWEGLIYHFNPVTLSGRGILYLLVSSLTLDPTQPPTPPLAHSFEQTTHPPSYVK